MAGRGKSNRAVARTRKIRARNFRLARIFGFIVALCLAFSLGFVIRDHPGFLSSLGLPSSITGIVDKNTTDSASTDDVYSSLAARFSEVEKLLQSDSLDSYDLGAATERVLEALADVSQDPYMRYYSQDRYNSLLNSPDEGYAGVGVLFSEYNGQAYAVDVFEGSQAQLKDVQEGDFVESINGDSSQTWSRSEVAAVLSQAEGSKIVITWRRPETLESDGGTEFTTTLSCKETDEPNVTTRYDEARRVGYVKVKQFTQNSAQLIQKGVKSLLDQGAEAFVLDLRDNPGGYLMQAVDTASLFMSSGTVVEVQTIDGVTAKSASGQPVTDAPLVVLINKNTAAAAEVVAAALKESQRANAVVGQTTLGKGSVQVISELSFGGALRYTAAYYLTPEGHAIDKTGVSPTVPLDASKKDQRVYAIELAGSLVPQE